MSRLVVVDVGKNTKPGRVGILEQDDRHPFDEVSGANRAFVSHDTGPQLVGMTELVAQKIQNHELKVVDESQLKGSAKKNAAKARRNAGDDGEIVKPEDVAPEDAADE